MSSASQQSLETILAELDNLKSASVLSDDKFSSFTRAFNEMLDQVKLDQARADSRIFVEAKYEFVGTEANDLSLKPGMKIEVLEKLNADWWRGQAVDSGTVGIFPSNYIEVIESKNGATANNTIAETPAKKSGYYGKKSESDPKPFNPKTEYSPPPNYQVQSFDNQHANYQHPSQLQAQHTQPPVQYEQEYPQQPVIVEQQPQRRHHPVLHRFGEAAIFGAGAAVGADIVNSIL